MIHYYLLGRLEQNAVLSMANATADSSNANREIEEQEKTLKRKAKAKAKGVKAFEQRVARAFAGDKYYSYLTGLDIAY